MLLHYSESHDRFVSIKELAYFELQTGEQQLVKIRIETPSKCNMGKAFQVIKTLTDAFIDAWGCCLLERACRLVCFYCKTKKKTTLFLTPSYSCVCVGAS